MVSLTTHLLDEAAGAAAPSMYWPAGHTRGVQTLEPAAARVPLAQAEHDAAPADAYVFAAQPEHAEEPVAEEYLPATQVTHWVPPVVSL